MPKTKSILEKVKYLRSVKGDLAGAIKLLENELPGLNDKEKAGGWYALGILYSDIGQNDKSKRSLNQAIADARKIADKLTLADALRRLGYVIWTTEGDESTALDLVRQAQEAIIDQKGIQFDKVRAGIWALTGNIHFDQGRFVEAKKFYQTGLKLAKKSKFIEREATILGDLGNLSLAEKQYPSALKYLDKAVKIAKKHNRHELPAALLRIGKVFFDSGNAARNLRKAEIYFKQTLEITLREGWKKDEAESYLALAGLKQEQGKKEPAADYNKKAREVYTQIGVKLAGNPRS